MRVPSKSKNAPTVGPSGLRSTSSTSSSSTAGCYPNRCAVQCDRRSAIGDGALGAVRHGQARLVEQFAADLVDEPDAVALVVGLEHLGGEHVAATVTGAGFGVDP